MLHFSVICFDVINNFFGKIFCIVYSFVDNNVASGSSVARWIFKIFSAQLPEFLPFDRFSFLLAVYQTHWIPLLLYAVGYKTVLSTVALCLQNESRQSVEFPRAIADRYLRSKPYSPFAPVIIGGRHETLISYYVNCRVCHIFRFYDRIGDRKFNLSRSLRLIFVGQL